MDIAFQKALELGEKATGPKKLGVFGASYLYPVFTNINSPVDVANKLLEQCEQVSEETGRTIKSSFNDDTPYQISRAVAAVLIFLNHADYASCVIIFSAS